MNYLAHIQLAHVTQTSKVGNFLGDFVKGSDLSHLPLNLQQGIRLHRSIDSFTDHHWAVTALRETFPAPIRRMSGVIMDVYFDHLLCQHWHRFNQHNIDTVLDAFYDELSIDTRALDFPSRFIKVKQGLLNNRWLQDYQQSASCTRAFSQIERRLQNKIVFAQTATEFWHDNQAQFMRAFLILYPDLIAHSKAFLHQTKKA